MLERTTNVFVSQLKMIFFPLVFINNEQEKNKTRGKVYCTKSCVNRRFKSFMENFTSQRGEKLVSSQRQKKRNHYNLWFAVRKKMFFFLDRR